jgi:hypothetical protein
MKITLEKTNKIVILTIGNAEVPARIWEGHTESGIAVHCFITRIAAAKDQDLSEFERELKEERAPSAAVEGIPLRLIL